MRVYGVVGMFARITADGRVISEVLFADGKEKMTASACGRTFLTNYIFENRFGKLHKSQQTAAVRFVS